MMPVFSYSADCKNLYEQEVTKWLVEDGVLTEELEAFTFYDGFDVNVYVSGDKEYNSQQLGAKGFLDKDNPYYAGYSEETGWETFDEYTYNEPNHYGISIFSELADSCQFNLVMSKDELNKITTQQCCLYVTKRMSNYNYGKELYGYLVTTQDGKDFEFNIVVGKHYAHDVDTAKFLVRTVYDELIRQYKADFNESNSMTHAYKQIESVMGVATDLAHQYEVNVLIEAIDGYGDKQKEEHQGLINSGRIEFMINRILDDEELPF